MPIDRTIIDPPILLNYTFFGLMVVMSPAPADEVVRASVLAKEVVTNERWWGRLLQNVPLLVVGVDRDGHIDYVNPHFIAVSGFSAEEAVGQALIDFVLPQGACGPPWRTAGPFFSTKSVSCRWSCRPNCCECYRNASSNALVARAP